MEQYIELARNMYLLLTAHELYSIGLGVFVLLGFIYQGARIRGLKLFIKEYTAKVHQLASEKHQAPPTEDQIQRWKQRYKAAKRGSAERRAYKKALTAHNRLED